MDEIQRLYIEEHFHKSISDLWKEKLINLKAMEIKDGQSHKSVEEALDEWTLIDIVEAPGNARPYQCMCGKKLKRKYVVLHNLRKIEYNFGINCFEKYTQINANVVKQFLEEKLEINSEKEEILLSMENNLQKCHQFLLDYKNRLPNEYMEQLRLGIPLSTKQLSKVVEKLNNSRVYHVIKSFNTLDIDVINFINNMPSDERQKLIVELESGEVINTIEDIQKIKMEQIKKREQPIKKNNPPTPSATENNNQQSVVNESSDKSILIQSMYKQRIIKASSFLTEKQRDFWRSDLSLNQRTEISEYIIKGERVFGKDVIGDYRGLDRKVRDQIDLEIPLTDKQISKYGFTLIK